MTKNLSSLIPKDDDKNKPSKSMLRLVETLSSSANKEKQNAPQQSDKQAPENEKSSVEQVVEQNGDSSKKEGEAIGEGLPNQNAEDKESQKQNSANKTEHFLVKMFDDYFKRLGVETKEEEKGGSVDIKKLIDTIKNAIKEFLGLKNENTQELQNQPMLDSIFNNQAKEIASDQASTQAPNQNPTQDPAKAPTQDPARASTQDPARAPTQAPNQNPAQDPAQAPNSITAQDPAQDPNQTQNSTSDQNEEKGENNADKLITQLIVELYEKEGKLDLLKQILDDEKGKDENKKNPEMLNLIKGFDSQIAEVENNRGQAVDKGEKGVENSEEVEVEPEEAINQNSVNKVIDNASSESKVADNKEPDQVLSGQPKKESEQGLENMGVRDNKFVDFKEGDLTDLEAIVARFNESGVVAEDMGSKDSVKPTNAISEKAAQENEKEGQER